MLYKSVGTRGNRESYSNPLLGASLLLQLLSSILTLLQPQICLYLLDKGYR
jgi:hypothetical protein